MARALAWVARAVLHHRRMVVIPQVVLFVLCVIYTVKCLQFDTSRDNLVGSNKLYHQNYLAFKREFPSQDDIVAVVESDDTEKNRQFVERLGAKLEGETNLFKNVIYKGDLKMLGSKALLFVPESDLKDLRQTLKDYRPFIEKFGKTTNLVSLFSMVNQQFRTAKREANAENDSLIKALPALGRVINQATASLRRTGTPPSPGLTALFNAGEDAEQEVYITFGHGRIYLVTAQALTDEMNGDAVERMRQLVEETRAEVAGINAGITGEPVLEHDEMEQSQKDTTKASIVSLLVCALIFIYGYQETGRPIKATLCLVVGLGYTMAFATFFVGHLNILTITFVPILIGLAIDYGVHLISRYEEELRHGKSEEDAVIKAIVYTGQGIFTGALTTAGAFLAMWFTNFRGIQEMGIICGGGLIVCLIPMMTILPVLLLRGRQNVIDHEALQKDERRARIENLWLGRPGILTIIIFALCAVAAIKVNDVYFDYNLLHMQSDGLPAVVFEDKLLSSSKSVLYAAVIATNLDDAKQLERRLTNLTTVASIDSMTKYLSEDQTNKLSMVGEIKQDLAGVRFAEPDRAPANISELSATLFYFGGYLSAAHGEAEKDEPELAKQLLAMRTDVNRLRKEMLNGDDAARAQNAQKIGLFQQALFDDLQETFEALKTQDNRAPLRVADLPAALRNRFIGTNGYYLLMVYPKKDVWQRENQKEFIEQIEPIYPKVTGTPVQLYHYTDLLKKSYEQAAWYSLIAIVILVVVHFRSPLAMALAMIPVGIGFLWLAGLMGWCGIPLNPANIMTLPLVIGIGVTNGIHILNRFAEEQTASILARSTGKAVLVSGLTAIAGFGSLMLAKHRGIESLGMVMSIGLATCMIAGLTFLPALLNLVVTRGEKRKRPSGDNAQSTLGREELR